MKNKHLTFKGVIIILVIAFMAMFITDFSVVKDGYEPIFAKFGSFTNDSVKYHVGPFYYFKEDFYDSPSRPLSQAGRVGVGVWFLPTVKIYSSNS